MKSVVAFLIMIVLATGNAFATLTIPPEGEVLGFIWSVEEGALYATYVNNEIVNEVDWGIEVDSPNGAFLSSVQAWDDFDSGDEFSLLLDGEVYPWEKIWYEEDFFHAMATCIYLPEGMHALSIQMDKFSPGSSDGMAYIAIGKTTTAAAASPVPEPATLFLFGLGAIGLVGIKKWKKK